MARMPLVAALPHPSPCLTASTTRWTLVGNEFECWWIFVKRIKCFRRHHRMPQSRRSWLNSWSGETRRVQVDSSGGCQYHLLPSRTRRDTAAHIYSGGKESRHWELLGCVDSFVDWRCGCWDEISLLWNIKTFTWLVTKVRFECWCLVVVNVWRLFLCRTWTMQSSCNFSFRNS